MIVTSLAVAREVGLEDQCVFIWGGASNADVVPSARAELGGSPAIRAAGKALFEATGVGIDDVDYIDLYSCFPSAVEAGAAAIGLATNDSRGLTLTGGLPFFGGPGNNYTAHGICTAVEKLRQSQGKAYVAANGGFLSKHALAIYGSSPPPRGFAGPDTRAAQEHIDAAALPVAKEGAEGEATVKGGTVVYGRDGAVASAPVIAQLDDGRRVVASAKPEALKDLAGRSLVGERVRIEGSPPTWS
jgi:acetyl-CoA C-acetyltransferase